jgi:hypothetical protein
VEGALVDIVGVLVDFVVGALVESFDPFSLGAFVFFDILGPLDDFMMGALEEFGALVSWAKAVAQRRAKRTKRVLMEFILTLRCEESCNNVVDIKIVRDLSCPVLAFEVL